MARDGGCATSLRCRWFDVSMMRVTEGSTVYYYIGGGETRHGCFSLPQWLRATFRAKRQGGWRWGGSFVRAGDGWAPERALLGGSTGTLCDETRPLFFPGKHWAEKLNPQ